MKGHKPEILAENKKIVCICSLSKLFTLSDLFGVLLDYIIMRSNERDNPLDTFDDIDLRILVQPRDMTHTKKDRLLKHLRCEKAMKNSNGK